MPSNLLLMLQVWSWGQTCFPGLSIALTQDTLSVTKVHPAPVTVRYLLHFSELEKMIPCFFLGVSDIAHKQRERERESKTERKIERGREVFTFTVNY